MHVIDAHQHFWNLSRLTYPWMTPDLTVLNRDYLPSDLSQHLRDVGVDRTVFVQATHDLDENRFALELAAENDWIAGVVGWVDLTAEDIDDALAEFAPLRKFVGVRHLVHDEADDDWLVRDDVLRGLERVAQHGLTYDLLLRPQHLKHVPTLARALPDLPMVIDHIAKPPIAEGRLDGWQDDLAAAAEHNNVVCKLSGMVTEAARDWQPRDLKPFVQFVVKAFGYDRLMFGSDWPVCLLAGSYGQVVDALMECLGSVNDDDWAMLMGGTAARFYGLPAGDPIAGDEDDDEGWS